MRGRLFLWVIEIPSPPHHRTNVGAACSRRLFIIQHLICLTHRIREQVESSHRRSHRGMVYTCGVTGRLSGRHREQAHSHRRSRTPFAPHHSTGRALARLQLLNLIHPPLRQAEWRCSSGGRRAAPCGEAAHIERRSKRSRPEAMPPDEYRNEGTPSLSEGPDAWGETFGPFGAFAKGTRRKGETISGRYRRNGYVHNPPRTWSAQRPPSQTHLSKP